MSRKLAVHLHWIWRQGWETASGKSPVRTREFRVADKPRVERIGHASPGGFQNRYRMEN
jgi:hypothetical protein